MHMFRLECLMFGVNPESPDAKARVAKRIEFQDTRLARLTGGIDPRANGKAHINGHTLRNTAMPISDVAPVQVVYNFDHGDWQFIRSFDDFSDCQLVQFFPNDDLILSEAKLAFKMLRDQGRGKTEAMNQVLMMIIEAGEALGV